MTISELLSAALVCAVPLSYAVGYMFGHRRGYHTARVRSWERHDALQAVRRAIEAKIR